MAIRLLDMKIFALVLAFVVTLLPVGVDASRSGISSAAIQWTDFETAVENNKNDPKPFFIDMYTDWCGWCSKMDMSTFASADVVEFVSENFHAVKFNPEKEESIAYRGKVYERKDYPQFKRAYNELAVSLMGSNMSFPTIVILSKKEVKMGTIPGFQVAEVLIAKAKALAKI